jgi:predicted dehydrogenase
MRVAFLGVSHWHAGMHAAGVLEAGAQIAGVWDSDATAVARFVEANGGVARPNAAAVLDDRPDLVVALGRGPEAAQQLAWLIEQDIPVLADKPIGLSHADVAPLADAAHQKNRFVAVALVNRIAGVIDALGDAGRCAHVYFRIINGPPHRYRDWGVSWMLDPKHSGGGALRNLGVHGIDAFLSIAGEQTVRVEHATFHSIFGEPVEDYACVVLRAADGTVGLVEAGYTHPAAGGTYELRVNSARGALVDTGSRLLLVPDRTPDNAGYVPSNQRYSAFMADTLGRVANRQPPAVSLTDFARATDLVDGAYNFAR